MSIPPLVCSTPPPPDQCEDDKDPEDFDLSYNLSQDDDDENNDFNSYGNFSSYNHFQSANDNKPLAIKEQMITKVIDTEVTQEIYTQYEHEQNRHTEQISISNDHFENNYINENKLKCEEDMNIEDLNLKLDEEIVTNIESSDENESSEQNTDGLKDSNVNNFIGSIQDDIITHELPCENTNNLPVCPCGVKESHVHSDEANTDQSYDVTIKNTTVSEDLKSHLSYGKDIESNSNLHSEETNTLTRDDVSESLNQFEFPSDKNVTEDDFGDFDDFKFANNDCNVTSVVDTSNPWETTSSNEFDFGNFTANFEENKSDIQDSSHLGSRSLNVCDQIENQNDAFKSNAEDDDFGDFDDFQSSAVKTDLNEVEEKDFCQELPVLNLQSSDNDQHIMESIAKVLTSVFIEEISEPESSFEGNLESLLSETWGHLMETDERQPYIINWNNSLGQKTLLKALCIDSRNILFGPKWCSHMPKYAANLSVAPLQPQKQVSSTSNILQSEVVADKASSKPTTWSDPFTSNGQEFTYAEALLLDLEHLMATLDQMAHNHSTLKISELLSNACNQDNDTSTITPSKSDLGVFEGVVSNKSEKIYSSTLGVQPIRQINLPDTHIFTPTDSEIPRSKTIHYDRSPPVLLPQPVLADSKNTDDVTQHTNNIEKSNSADDNEYWEFQDFKSTSDSSFLSGSINQVQSPKDNNFTSATISALPKPSMAYQTQLLQPIKVEPSMPSLNWPDPGEVKATYDDFTDFVSISSQSTDKQDNTPIQLSDSQETNRNKSDKLDELQDRVGDTFTEAKFDSKGFDDNFESFQSALPSKDTKNDFTPKPLGSLTNVDCNAPRNSSTKSDSLSFASIPRLNDALIKKLGNYSNVTELTNKNSLPVVTQLQTSLLQPTTSSYNILNTQIQRPTNQILQPLSLESYSQINWPSPGIDLQDLSKFNPVETLQSLKSDLSSTNVGKGASPGHTPKNVAGNQSSDDDVWGEFVSSKPKQQQSVPKKTPAFVEDDEWTDFISSPSVKPPNGLNTISLNVHTNSNIQKAVNKFSMKTNQTPVDIPTLNYITPKLNVHKTYSTSDKHFQNL